MKTFTLGCRKQVKQKLFIFSSFLFLLVFLDAKHVSAQQIFRHDFNGAAIPNTANSQITNTDYYTATNDANRFTNIQCGNHSTSYMSFNSATADQFTTADAGTGFVWMMCRNQAMTATAPTAMKIQFNAKFDVNSTGTTNPRFTFQVGSGFSNTFSTTNMAMKEPDANVFGGFCLKSQNSTNGPTLFRNNGSTQIGVTNIGEAFNTWTIVLNNSGASLNYTDPTGATESLADDAMDLWIGTTKWGNDIPAVTGTQTLEHFKFGAFGNSSGGRINFSMDWIQVDDISPASSNPTITLNTVGFTGNFGNTVTGTNSGEMNYAVSGSNLTADIVITAPSGFQVSTTSGSGFGSIVNLTPVSGTISSTNVYVRYSPSAATGGTGILNITHTSTGATTKDAAVSGNAIATQPATSGSISFGTVTGGAIVVNLPAVGNGDRRIIVAKQGSAVDFIPSDGNAPTGVNADFSAAADQGSGNKIIYDGTGSGNGVVTVTGLNGLTTYHFAVFEYNVGTGTSENYLETPVTASQATLDGTLTSDHFRSVAGGNWNAAAIWESSHDGTTWMAATSGPDDLAAAITIRNGHTVTVSTNVSADDVVIATGGTVEVSAGITLTVANGAAANDLVVDGTLKNAGTLTATGVVAVNSGGIYDHAVDYSGANVTVPTITWNAGSTLKLSGVYSYSAGDILLASTITAGTNVLFAANISDAANGRFRLLSINAVLGNVKVTNTGAGVLYSANADNTTGTTVSSFELINGNFYINRNGGATNRALTITGDLIISGGVFDLKSGTSTSNGQLNIGGNITVTGGSFTRSGTGGTGTVTFNGTGSQAVTFAPTGTINYVVNKASGTLTLGSDLPVNGSLTFTAGNITTASNKVIITSTGSMVNAGTNGWIAGNLQKNVAAGAAVARTFEVGDATGYRPASVTLANVSTAGDLTASVSQTAGDHAAIAGSGLDAGKTVNRYWIITNSGVVFDQYDVVFTFLAADVDASANTAAFIIKKHNGVAWSSTTAGIRTATTTQATGVTAFSDFTIGEAASAGAPPTVSTQPNSGGICVGSNTSFTSASLSSPSPTVQWERSVDGTVWVAIDGTLDGGIYSDFTTGTLNITGATAGINGYQYRAVFTNVNGSVNSNTATLTVDPTSVGGTTAGTQTICSGTTPADLTLSGNTGSVVKWQKASDAVFTTPVDIASTSTTLSGAVIGSLSATTYFRAVVKSGACADDHSSVATVTVNPLPSVTTANTASVCSGVASNISLTASVASNFSWAIGTISGGITGATGASGSTITQTLINPSNSTAGTVQYIVTPTSTATPACGGSDYIITVTVNPKPVVTSSNTTTICSNTATNITLTASAAGSFSWTLGTNTGGITGGSAGSGNSIAQTLTNPGNGATGSLEYLVTTTSTTGSCVSDAYTITAAVNPIPVVTTPNTATICSDDITSISLTSSTASTFTWTVGTITGAITGGSAGSGNTIAQVLTNPSTVTSGTLQFIVTATSTAIPSCAGSPYTITVTVNPGSGGLAGTSGGPSVCESHDATTSPDYYNSCNPIAKITPSGGNPVSGAVDACVRVDAATNLSYVPRTYIISATANNTANVTLYFLQSEFNTYNTATTSGDLPVNGSDATGKANLRISIIPIASHTPGGLGEAVYNPNDADIVFNSAANRWEVTLPMTFSANNSFFVHTSNWTLPVSLVDFKGEQSGATNKLTWSTATENNSKGFEVERSADGKNFSSIGFVSSKAENGNSTSLLNYQLIDNRPFAGNSYYRLKQIDRDGRSAYSKVILLATKTDVISLNAIYPNPAVKELNVVINSPKAGKITLVITDLSGKVIMHKATSVIAGVNQQTMNVEQLSSGSYIIKAICADGCETAIQRFIKQ